MKQVNCDLCTNPIGPVTYERDDSELWLEKHPLRIRISFAWIEVEERMPDICPTCMVTATSEALDGYATKIINKQRGNT